MEARNQPQRKEVQAPRRPYSPQAVRRPRQPCPPPAPRHPFTVRSAVIFETALFAAIGAGILLRAAHNTPADAVLGALAIFGLALKLASDLIG